MRLLKLAALLVLLAPTGALAEPAREQPAARPAHPFRTLLGVGTYGTGWSGDYRGAGIGGRIRVEPWRHLGVDLFGEIVQVQVPHGQRRDVPLGFHLYTPIALTDDLRLRPFLGMCVAGSFLRPDTPDAPRADDVMGGALLGLGLDVALHERISLVAEAKGVAWVGHDRAVHRWTGSVDNDVRPFLLAQAQLGLMMHLGDQ